MPPMPTATTTAEAAATDEDASSATTAAEQPRWSEAVYVLGSDPRATYLAHMLSGLPHSPPVRLLLSGQAMTNWLEEGRRVRLVRAGVVQPRARVVAELLEQPTDAALLAAAAAADAPASTQRRVRSRHRHIENLVVTLPCARSINAIRWLRHRIDHRTTICLLQSGLGVAERLNELFFADEASRPRYVLGYMTHDLGYGSHERNFTLTELVPGILRLTAYYPQAAAGADSTGGADVSGGELQLVRLLGLTPTLGAGGYEVDEFLRWKLPEMVSTAAVEPIATVLDLAPNVVWQNGESRALVEGLIREMVAVVAQLPETQGSPMLAEFVQSGMLVRQAQQGRQRGPPPAHEDVDEMAAQNREARLRPVRAATQSTVECRMAKLVREGRVTDIQFLNGWFVRRGREVGVNCPLNEMVMRLVRAKQKTGRAQIDSYIPLVEEDAAAAEPRPVSTEWSSPQRQRTTTTTTRQWASDEDSGRIDDDEAEDMWTGQGETLESLGGYYY